jgi:hypothetical protein
LSISQGFFCSSLFRPFVLKQLITHSIHPDCCQDQSEATSQTETSKVSIGDNDSKEDIEVEVPEVNEDKTSVDDTDLADGGKKDPFVRRQELLINSGLAEVGSFCFPSTYLVILPCFILVFYTGVFLRIFLNLWLLT